MGVIEDEALRDFGTTLVVAPHPDDESLGCGGLMAMLGDAGVSVFALLVSDGTQSHPRSRAYDVPARAALRDAEWCTALACLGVPEQRAIRLGLPDGRVPVANEAGFADAVACCRSAIDRIDPRTVLLPWRRDPHPDHRASHALARAALAGRIVAPRLLEYAVWAEERGTIGDRPQVGEARTWQLDIARAVERKRRAIAAHRSQHGEVITDDPQGFTLAPAMRARAERPLEEFIEVLP